ncbi:Arsenical resistance operon repressor [Sphingomonas antarctica]|uniref:ArsR/SmtB family transcription factor n=1 Tax=Sphingomonas antarctica TaxID=2040274 RepID=UPI0039E7E8B4
MEAKLAIDALAALAQEHRLAVFRYLIQRGADGAIAGDIAIEVALPPSSLSFHLAHLTRAGLIVRRRFGRSLNYSVDYAVMGDLMTYLTENCCGGEFCLTSNSLGLGAAA